MAAVLCTYFGEPLGIFTKASLPLAGEDARLLAHQITAVQPDQVLCAVPAD